MDLPEGSAVMARHGRLGWFQNFQQMRRLRRLKSFNANAAMLVLLVAIWILIWLCFVYATTFSKSSAMEEINSQLNLLTITKQEQDEQLHLHKLTYVEPKRVLLVGLIASPRELYENQSVLESIYKLCYAYKGNVGDRKGFVELQVMYQDDKMIDSKLMVSRLTELLQVAECKTSFQSEDQVLNQTNSSQRIDQESFNAISRYRKLARLRSVQRQLILSQYSVGDFDAVINVDLDIVQFPPLHALLEAIERAANAATTEEGTIVCANGHETWTVGSSLIQRTLFYDTFAAIDINGEYYYQKYAASIWQIVTFGQTNLFRDILQQHPALWPMQTCFGGLAIYDFPSWSNLDCDYDQRNINLRASSQLPPGARGSLELDQQISQFKHMPPWKVLPQYTIDNTPNGDVCEHVVFQQCLLAANLARNKPTPNVGIQPNLLIGREAAILSQPEDKLNFVKKILFIFLLLNGMFLLLYNMGEWFEYIFRYAGIARWKTLPMQRRSDNHSHKA